MSPVPTGSRASVADPLFRSMKNNGSKPPTDARSSGSGLQSSAASEEEPGCRFAHPGYTLICRRGRRPAARSPLQPGDQARRIPAAAAHLLYLGIELIDQRAHRQARAVLARLAQANGEILAHPVDRKAEIELPRRHGLVAVFHLPGLRRPLGDGLDHRIDIEPRLFGEM